MSRISLPIALGLGAALLAAACAAAPTTTPNPTPASTSSPTMTPSATPVSTPGPTVAPTPGPTVAPTPGPTVAPTPGPTRAPTSSPTAAHTASPSPTPTEAPPDGSIVVTFRVVDEQYRILLSDPVDIAIARLLLAGEEAPTIPNGLIVRGETGVNIGWSWSIDPDSLEFADATTEVCDGLPSHVEDGTLAVDRYCPWGAELIAIDPVGE